MIKITCYFCFENFIIDIEYVEGKNVEIWDCHICCNPNKVEYQFRQKDLQILEISSGNE
jgi:hypothetical protein